MPSPAPRPWEVRAWGLAAGLVIVRLARTPSGLSSDERTWAVFATVVVAVVVAEALPRARRLLPTRTVVMLTIGAAALAVYGCVPETSNQMPLVAAVVAAITLAELRCRRQVHLGFHALAAAIVLWSGIYGATGRQSALVGALFAMWPIVIVPAVALLVPRLARTAEPVRWLVALFGAGAAIAVARTGALQPTRQPAVVAVAVWGGASLAAAVLVTVLAGRLSDRAASGTPPA